MVSPEEKNQNGESSGNKKALVIAVSEYNNLPAEK